jgi:hypothetical protein
MVFISQTGGASNPETYPISAKKELIRVNRQTSNRPIMRRRSVPHTNSHINNEMNSFQAARVMKTFTARELGGLKEIR